MGNQTIRICLLAATSALVLAGLAFPFPIRAAAAAPVIDDCQYSTDAAARAAWKAMAGSKPAAAAVVEGRNVLRLSCNFAGTQTERASWDRAVSLDLAAAGGFQLRVRCRDTAPVSYFSLYFQSGEGWYQATFFPESSPDWNTISLDKTEFKPEGKPAGWDRIKTIRISAWRAKDVDTECCLGDFRQSPPLPPPSPRQAAETALAQIGRVASFQSYEAATNQIGAARGNDPSVAKALAETAAWRGAAARLIAQEQFAEAQAPATAAREQLTRAFCLAQQPLPGEFRAFWCHSAFGVKGLEWDEAIRRLADNGFTAVLPNMLWGGVAFYDSKVLPVAAEASGRGDQIRKCVEACRKYGLEIHVWKVNWNLGRAAPTDLVEKLRGQRRLQASAAGKEEPWLCPSHPDNQQLEIATMIEVARNYDVDGVHFDYIRYPDNDHCYCAGCRERFQRACGAPLKHWPGDVLGGGAWRQRWLDWRRRNITTVVQAVSEQARALKPKIKISAAVFRNWPVDRDGVGQDWKLWCDKGYLDFVCPMDYTPINTRFENMVAQQIEWAGKVPCYPGIGVSASSSHFGPDRVVEQINITRRHHTRGFVIFNYAVKESEELLPLLGLGITRKR